MAALVALLSLCVSALPPCPDGNGLECTSIIAENFKRATAIDISPDDMLVAVASADDLRVYDIATGTAVAARHDGETTDSSFSPDGASLAVAADDGVGVISLSTGQELWFDKAGGKYVAVAYSPDGSRLASHLFTTGDVHIRDAATGEVLMTLKGPKAAIPALHYTPDGSNVICGGAQWAPPAVHVWDATTGELLQELSHPPTVSGVTISPDGQHLAVGTWGKKLTIYRVSDYTPVHTISTSFPPIGLSFSHDSSELLVTGHGYDYQIYSVASGTKQRSYTAATYNTNGATFLHNSNGFLTVADKPDAPLLLWKPAGPVQLVSASGTQDVAGVPVAGAEVSLPAGGLALSGVPASLQGSSTAHATRVAVGEKLRLSCASGSCGFVVAVYACKRCADAANDFEAQMVAAGYTHLTCAPMFSVAGGSASGQYVMRAYHIPVTSSDPIELEAVVHATQHVVAFQLDSAMGVSPPSCPPKHFSGPSPPCLCVQ